MNPKTPEGQPFNLEPFPNPADPDVDPPTDEERWSDFERQGDEERGLKPLPCKTFPFWASLIASILAFALFSGYINPDSDLYTVLEATVIPLLAHFGYDRVVTVIRRRRSALLTGSAPYRRPLFWASALAMMCSYLMGSGLPADAVVMQITGWLVLALGYVGVNVQVWIRRRDMADPFEEPESFWLRLSRLLTNSKRK